ncbi:helix-turn-helix transcriptional regulator [Bradyrhizobium sp. WSM2254]|uniref:helix-turn-helix transcriptional regulator n=1 Tax=Bradyrhizobium sp. WSM2254 TaxID=1188263 RepID=UPI000675E2BA|nr:helix-turn-helix transcriptional regulator [Bradyrhizobium sp. WSM2254]
MKVEARDYASLHFSTLGLPPPKRLPALRDLFDQAVRLQIDAEPGHAVEMKMNVAPGLRRAQMLSSFTARLTRPSQMLADGEDTVCLMIKTGGHMALTQGRREGIPKVGDGVLLVYREPAFLRFVDATYLSVRVPFSAIAPLARNVAAAAAHCIPRDTEALSLLQSYVASLPERIADPQLGRLAAMHVYDLVALAIGATDEGREIASQRGVRVARLEAIKGHLIQNVALSLDQVAARQGISPRYIQMLFEEAGTTFSDFVLERRLEAARTMLTSPRFAACSIAAIALEAGFGDLSYFNRRFKRRYLMTPTDLRMLTTLGSDFPLR